MQNLRQVLWGIALALISFFLILGGFVSSFAESEVTQSVTSPTPSATPTWQPFTPLLASSTPLPPTWTPSLPPPPTHCPPPAGWVLLLIQPGDTLETLAALYQTTGEVLMQANCLLTPNLLPGAYLYVPPLPTPTFPHVFSPTPCQPPAGWVIYIVRPGDTLYALSQAYGITVADLQKANCMTGTLIRVNQKLYVPPWATRTPSPTPFSPPAFTETPTPTVTLTLTETAPPTPTPTASETPSDTSTPSPTATQSS